MPASRTQHSGPPSSKRRAIGVIAALVLALAAFSCGPEPSQEVTAADATSDGALDIDLRVRPDVGADVVDAPDARGPSDAATQDVVVQDVTTPSDVQPPDVAVQDVIDDALVPPRSDWVPEDGEWVSGICPPGALPSVGDLDPEIWPWFDELPPDTGYCHCGPWVCFEVPPEAFLQPVKTRLGMYLEPGIGTTAVSFVFRGMFSNEVYRDAPERVNPDVPWRVAIRMFSEEQVPSASIDAVEAFGYISTRSIDDYPIPTPYPLGGGWVADGVYAFEWYPVGANRAAFYLGERLPEDRSFCGDGIIDPETEECDTGDTPGDPRDWQCAGCRVYETQHCEGEPSVCMYRCVERVCDDDGCRNQRMACDEPPGPCLRGTCDQRVADCVWRPTDEGLPCVRAEDDVAGWCDAGVCSPEPRECVHCEGGGRWVDGACHDTEAGVVWHAGGGETQLGVSVENGARHVTPLAGEIHFTSPYVSGRTVGQGSRPEVVIDNAIVQVQYRTRPWDSPTETTMSDIDGRTFELLDDSNGWTVGEFQLGRVRTSYLWLFAKVSWHQTSGIAAIYDGEISVRRFRYSELGLGVCEEGVDVDGEWFTCMSDVGMAWCGDACVDLTSNDVHCGECGNRCTGTDVCVGGECSCERILAQFAPDRCGVGECPENHFGPDCVPCPSMDESGVVCSGNGSCADGMFGSGRCDCDDEFHGVVCEFSATDGIRNGTEQNVDCGYLPYRCRGF